MPEDMKVKKYDIATMMMLSTTMDVRFQKDTRTPKKIVEEMHQHITEYKNSIFIQHQAMKEVMRMSSPDQWDPVVAAERDDEGKPCGTFNVLSNIEESTVNKHLLSNIQVRVNAKDLRGEDFTAQSSDAMFMSDDTDKKYTTAQFYQGWINAILHNSSCADHFNNVLRRAVKYGYGGYLLLYVDKVDELSDDNEIKFTSNSNPFSWLMDPTTREADFSDMNYFFDSYSITKKEAEALFGKRRCFEGGSWEYDDNASLSEYMLNTKKDWVKIVDAWERRRIKKKVVELSDGYHMFLEDYKEQRGLLEIQGIYPVGEVVSRTFWQVKKYIICKDTLLREGEVVPGFNRIPVLPLVGRKEDCIDPKTGAWTTRYYGITEHCHHAQKGLNVVMSNLVDKVGRNQSNNYTITGADGEVADDITEALQSSGPKCIPIPDGVNLLPVPNTPISMDDIRLADLFVPLIKDIAGVSHASLGQRSNEESGRAIEARATQSDEGMLVFARNSQTMIKSAAELIATCSRLIYGEGRVVWILDENGQSVPITIGKTQEMIGRDGSTIMKFANDIDRDIKLDIVVEHNLQSESRRDQKNKALLEMLTNAQDPTLQTLLMAEVIKDNGGPGAAQAADRMINSMLDIKQLTPDEVERRVRMKNEVMQRIGKLQQEQLDLGEFDPEQEPDDPEVLQEQEQTKQEQAKTEQENIKLMQEQVKLDIAEKEAGVKGDMAKLEYDKEVANTEGKKAAARQQEAAANTAIETTRKTQVEADAKLQELGMKQREAQQDMKTIAEEVVMELINQGVIATNNPQQ